MEVDEVIGVLSRLAEAATKAYEKQKKNQKKYFKNCFLNVYVAFATLKTIPVVKKIDTGMLHGVIQYTIQERRYFLSKYLPLSASSFRPRYSESSP